MERALHSVLLVYFMCSLATAQTACTRGDIRLRGEHGNATAVSGGVDVCMGSGWRAVCNHEAWNSNTVQTANAKVACRQLEYREEGATNQAIDETAITSVGTTDLGLRQSSCTGTELRLIDCPLTGGNGQCATRAFLTCQLVTCDTTIRLRGGRTATDGRVEVCRDGQWGTVCDDSWDRNDASVACRQLGLSDLNAVAVPTEYFGAGSGEIHLSNLQCTGSEAALTDCTFDTEHQCSHNQDASVICQQNEPQCIANQIRIAYESEVKSLEVCRSEVWNTCMGNSACKDMNVTQHGTYICGSTAQHFFTVNNRLYECQIPDAIELLLCTPATVDATNNCHKVLQDLELQASSSSVTVAWGNAASYINTTAEYEITCSPEGSDLRHSIAVEPTTSEVTMENLPHSTTYECCVTLHIGRYSTRACNNTATLSYTNELPNVPGTTHSSTNNKQFQNDAIQGAALWVIIALGVLVAVLVLLLVLATGACLYLLITRRNSSGGAHTRTNGNTYSTSEERYFENPSYTSHELPKVTPQPSPTPHTPAPPPHTTLTPHTPPPHTTLTPHTPAPPPHTTLTPHTPPPHTTLTPHFPANEMEVVFSSNSQYSVVQPCETGVTYSVVHKNGKNTREEERNHTADQMPTYEVPIVSMESLGPAGERAPEEYSRLKR